MFSPFFAKTHPCQKRASNDGALGDPERVSLPASFFGDFVLEAKNLIFVLTDTKNVGFRKAVI
jgi:hypothetical protein